MLLAALLPWLAEWLATPPADTRLESAQVGESIDDPQARRVGLPHRWASPWPGWTQAWYRLDLDDVRARAGRTGDPWALLLPQVRDNAFVYLNGHLLARGGRFEPPSARLGARPLWAPVPARIWQDTGNRLYVVVRSDDPGRGLMPAPALGIGERLAPSWRWRRALTVTLPQLSAGAALLLAAIMTALWTQRRQELAYAALAAAAATYGVHLLATLVVEPPWPGRGWPGLLAATGAAWVAASAALVATVEPAARLRHCGRLAAGAFAAVAVAAAVAGWSADRAWLERAWPLGLCVIGALWALRAWRRGEVWPLWAGAAVAAAALYDLLRPVWSADAVPVLPIAAAAWLGLASWQMLRRFVNTLNAVELLRVDLEALVNERTAELHTQFKRVRELERQQTLAAERERLMRDMHDGVGGHLVAMLAMIEAERHEPGELARAARDALDDMRLMIDSLEPVDDDLNVVLAMLHDRLAPRLRAAGVELAWKVDLLPAVPGLSPARVLHVMRILQEAVSNAMRHGRARSLCLVATARSSVVHIEVHDDGGGFDPDALVAGRGLANMRRRAAEAGAVLGVRSRPGEGTTVTLCWTLVVQGLVPEAGV